MIALYAISIPFAYLLIAGLVYEVKRVAWGEEAKTAAVLWPLLAVLVVVCLVFRLVAIDAPRAILRRPRAEVRRG